MTWVPKGQKKDDAEEDEEWVEPEHVEKEVDPAKRWVDDGPQGCVYDLKAILKVFTTQRTSGALAEAPADWKWRTIELPREEVPEEKPPQREPGARRAAKQRQREERAALLAQGYLEAPLDVEGRARAPTAGTEDGEDAADANLQPDPRLLAFLSSMQMAYSAQMYPVDYGQSNDYTTIMLRNIPNRYTRDMLMDRLNVSYANEYDFLYLPIDFSNGCNVGYCFINFRTPAICQRFMQEFHGSQSKHVLPGFSSSKVCEVRAARVQGRDTNMQNLRDEKFIEKLVARPECQPIFFDEAGNPLDFKETFGATTGRRRKGSKASGASPTASPMGPTPAAFPQYMPWMPMMPPPPNVPLPALDPAEAVRQFRGKGPARLAGERKGKGRNSASQSNGSRPGLGHQETQQVREQIEFYFSFSNLIKDLYLRSHMSEAGWLPLEIIAKFPKVSRFGVTLKEVAAAVRSSQLVEVNDEGTEIRLLASTPEAETQRAAWAKVPESYKSTLSAPAAAAPAP